MSPRGWGAALDFGAALDHIAEHTHHTLCALRAGHLTPWRSTLPRVWDMVIAEVRLHPDDDQADVMGAIVAQPGRTFNEVNRLADLPQAAPWGPWVRAFVRHERVPLLWLEWDCPQGTPRPPLTSAALSPRLLGGAPGRDAPADPRGQSAVLRSLTPVFGPSTALAADTILRWVDHTPPGWDVLHAAPLLARGREGMRLTLSIPAWRIPTWLTSSDLPIDADLVRPIVAALHQPFARVSLQVEVTPSGSGYLAIETQEAATTHVDVRHLQATVRKAEAAVDDAAVEALADYVGEGMIEQGDDVFRVLRTCYLKLIPTRERLLAKAYLGVIGAGGPR